MGTNIYVRRNTCPVCKRCEESDIYHVGKSSAGWAFTLHVDHAHPDLASIYDECNQPGARIFNEYGDELTLEELTETIQGRARPAKDRAELDAMAKRWGYNSYAAMTEATGAVEDKVNNIWRHKIDGRHCIGHGPGTYDYIRGEFS